MLHKAKLSDYAPVAGFCTYCGGFTLHLAPNGYEVPGRLAIESVNAFRCNICSGPVRGSWAADAMLEGDLETMAELLNAPRFARDYTSGFPLPMLLRAFHRKALDTDSRRIDGFELLLASETSRRVSGLVTGALCLAVLFQAVRKVQDGEVCATVSVANEGWSEPVNPHWLLVHLENEVAKRGFSPLSNEEREQVVASIVGRDLKKDEANILDDMVKCVPRLAPLVALARDPGLGNIVALVALVLTISQGRKDRRK